jgi:cephalosporin-C deacetylase-like acetyl esterase
VGLATVLSILLLSNPGGPQGYTQDSYPFKVKSHGELVKLFDYPTDAPLDVQEDLMLERAGIRVLDVSFRVTSEKTRTSAYLVLPSGKGPFPAVVFLHSSGGRDAFLPTAILLARAGVVGLALQNVRGLPMPQAMQHDIVAVRRAFDVLVARGNTDSKRIGAVGHSYGSMMIAVVAGVDDRFKCFVIEGGTLGMSYHLRFTTHPVTASWRDAMPPAKRQEMLAAIAPFDAVHYIGHATAPLLFQSARFDVGVSEQESLDLFETASGPKEIRWYESGHEMGNDPAVVKDRLEFLSRQLGCPSLVPLLLKDMGLPRGQGRPTRQ